MSRQKESNFVPDGYVRPVYRNGRYICLLEPGDLVVPIPNIREIGPLINVIPRPHTFVFEKIHSREGRPLKITMSMEYAFDPSVLGREAIIVELRLTPEARHQIIHNMLERVLRELVAQHEAKRLYHHPSSAGLGQATYIRVARPLLQRGIRLRSQSMYIKDVQYDDPPAEMTSAPPPAEPKIQHEQATPPMPPPSPPADTPLPEDLPEAPKDPPKPKRPDVLRRR